MKTVVKIIIPLLIGCCFIRCNSQQKVSDENKKEVLSLDPGINNPRNSEGAFIQLNDGRILFVYSHFIKNDTASGDFGHGYLAGRFSEDDGKTWSDKDEIIVGQEGTINVMSASLLRLRNGDIALFYLKKNSDSDCIPMLRISKDETRNWSEPVTCITDKKGYFVLNNDRGIQLKNERLLVPVSLHKTPSDSSFRHKGKIFCYRSDDNGKSWMTSEQVPNPKNVMLQEPGLIELKNGELIMFMRTNTGVQYFSYSSDNGESWSPVEPGNIISPASPASIKRIPSTGDLLLVWNNNGNDRARTPLNIAISKDEGKTWERMKILEDDPDGWYCYTGIFFTDKHVLLSYCAGSQSQKTYLSVTNITRLSLDWIYQK